MSTYDTGRVREGSGGGRRRRLDYKKKVLVSSTVPDVFSRMGEISGIYSIYTAVNNKTYIGQSATVFRRRSQHWHHLRVGTHRNPHLQAAWNLYGAAAFAFTVLKECCKEALGKEEILELAKIPLELRYNIGPAGYCPNLGRVQSAENKLRISRGGGGRPFFAKSLSTGEERHFLHTGEAVSAGFDKTSISRCLLRKQSTHNNHTFRYDETFVPGPPFPRPVRVVRRAILRTDIWTGATKQYASVSDAVRDGFTRPLIYACLNGTKPWYRSFRWGYVDGKPHRGK